MFKRIITKMDEEDLKNACNLSCDELDQFQDAYFQENEDMIDLHCMPDELLIRRYI
jgi:hypothetical protein